MDDKPPSGISYPERDNYIYWNPLPSPFYLHRVLFRSTAKQKSDDRTGGADGSGNNRCSSLLENDGDT